MFKGVFLLCSQKNTFFYAGIVENISHATLYLTHSNFKFKLGANRFNSCLDIGLSLFIVRSEFNEDQVG